MLLCSHLYWQCQKPIQSLVGGTSGCPTGLRLKSLSKSTHKWREQALGTKKSLSVAYLRPAGTELSDLTAALKHQWARWLWLPKTMISIDLIWDQGRLDAKDKRSWEDWKNDTVWICVFVTNILSLLVSVCQSFCNKQGTSVIDLSEYKSHQKSKSRKVQDNSKKNKYDLWIVLGIGELTCCLFAPAIHFDSRIVSG